MERVTRFLEPLSQREQILVEHAKMVDQCFDLACIVVRIGGEYALCPHDRQLG
jgi:hypothetical protein